MKIQRFLYKAVVRIQRTICWKFDNIVTKFKFFCLCDEYHNFETHGIPFLNVSKNSNSYISFGKNLRLNNGMSSNQIGFGDVPCVFIADGGRIIISNNVGISQSTFWASNGCDIIIGDNTIVGGGVRVYTSDFHSVDYKIRRTPNIENKIIKGQSVLIGEDCFIGAGTTILKGVSIGDRVIIGAGSVVTSDIPSDCIAAGNPCHVIKTF